MKRIILIYLINMCCLFYSNTIQSQDYSRVAENQINKIFQNETDSSQKVEWKITNEHTSSISNIHHVYFSQVLNGIKIENTESSIHYLSDDELIIKNNRFINLSTKKIISKSSNSLTALDAVKLVANQLKYSIVIPLKIIEKSKGIEKNTLISNGGFSFNDVTAKLTYVLNDKDEIVLAWQIDVLEKSFDHNWNIFMDVNSGIILKKIDNLFNCIEPENKDNTELNKQINRVFDKNKGNNNEFLDCVNCYEVFPYPLESPYYGERTIVINPASSVASPFGWHDFNELPGPESFLTTGNNITAFKSNTGYQPDGGQLLNFTEYPFDSNYSEGNNYKDASLTNLFYWGNILHDVLYVYGFDEVAGNFQANNYNNGGFGDDNINIYGQDDLNCNAGIAMFPDGKEPYMFMGLCGNKDSGVDNLVIAHEYGHGYTYRLLGGPGSANCFMGPERLSEGYSDWLGLLLTMNSSSLGSTPRGYATYFFDQGSNGAGIRPYPYSTDLEINPFVYGSYPLFDPILNWVWGSVLWELTWALIDEYGFNENLNNFTGNIDQDTGNVMVLALVTESLKLLNCAPNMIDARNAILVANRTIYGSEKECLLWEAFAKRGLGIHASEGVSSFETPSLEASFEAVPSVFCENAELMTVLSGGLPIGGIYSGLGVIDDGNGLTYSFNPEIVGLGIHSIHYEVPNSFCSIASTTSSSIIVEKDNISPSVICLGNISVMIPIDESDHSLSDYSLSLIITDNCTGDFAINQTPIPGTSLGVGIYNVEFEVRDFTGNKSNCSFVLKVEKMVSFGNSVIDIYPNPTNGVLSISSIIDIKSLNAKVFDLNGRLIKDVFFNEFGFEKSINLKNLSTGLYFIKIESNETSLIQRIIKK